MKLDYKQMEPLDFMHRLSEMHRIQDISFDQGAPGYRADKDIGITFRVLDPIRGDFREETRLITP